METLFNLPEKVIFCNKCVMSNQRPTSMPEFRHTKNRDGAKYLQIDGDGVCDACTVMGGFTTEDEMFIVTGNYYVPEPPFALGIIPGLVLLGLLNARRKQRHI